MNDRIEETAAPTPDQVELEVAQTDAVHTEPMENAEPVEVELAEAPTTTEPTTTEPTAAEPLAAEPPATEQAAPKPATAEPTAAEPTAPKPATAEPTTAEPATTEPTASELAATQPTMAELPAPEPAVAEPAVAEPTVAEVATAETAEAGPIAADMAAAELAAAESAAAESAVAEPTEAAEEPAAAEVRDDKRGSRVELHLSDDIQFSDLDPEARRELRSLTKSTAETVGRHLVAAGRLIDEDPELALAHARFARVRAARVAVVREAAGLAAYHAGEWAEALGELRAVRRMSGGQAHLPVMVDCERALGRPERALELAAEATDLPKDVAIELKIVTAGARRDMGQLDAAVVALQGPDLDPKLREPWSPRLFYAYADNLEAAGRTDDAIRWFLNAAEADVDEDTDAAERAFELRERE